MIHSVEAGASLQTVGDQILTSKIIQILFGAAALEAQSEEEASADAEALTMSTYLGKIDM